MLERLGQRLHRLVSRLRISWVIAAYFLLYSAMGIYKHLIFQSNAWDLGIFSQAVWQYSRFEIGFNTVRGLPCLLGDHFHPILMGFAPLYWIWKDPIMLLLAQALLVAAAAYPIHRVARSKLQDDFMAMAVSIAYLGFWGIFAAVTFDFHPIIVFLPLLAFAYYFLDGERTLPFMLMVALMLLVEEDMIMTVFALGVYVLLRRKYFLGLSICAISLGWFFTVTQVFIPQISTSSYAYWQHYAYLGPNMWRAALKLLSNPLRIFKYLFYPLRKVLLILMMLLPFAFLPLLGLFSIVGLPYLAQRFLSDYHGHWAPASHYNAVFGVIFALAAVEAAAFLARRRGEGRGGLLARIPVRKLTAAMLAVGLLCTAAYPVGLLIAFDPAEEIPRAREGYRLLSEIPPDSFVVAQSSMVPHLSEREDIYVYAEEPGLEGMSHTNYELLDFSRRNRILERADYIILNPGMDSFPTQKSQVAVRIAALRRDPRYIAHEFGHGWIYFEKARDADGDQASSAPR